MTTTNSFAILAPVPEMHLLSAMEVMAQLAGEQGDEKPKIAFGSMDFELFRKIDESRTGKNVKVLIYASHSDAEQPFYSQASWEAVYIGHVNSRNGRYPGKAKFRPPSTASDKPTWAVFWEVQDLKPIACPVQVGSLIGLGKKSEYNSRFVPERPLLIEYPLDISCGIR
ncbi:hypothetical protein [Nostoc sp. MS1]|uniref:hypothetical protein n=1 Tax=Nostoc sp. MS1 TaxID=2764711 RepID=UPI001CC5E663|nr:hypothetical protein [Nostoc sp. MS1]